MASGPLVSKRLGVDLGNVLTERRADGLPVFADDRYPLQPSPGAFEAIRALATVLGSENVFLVSRCSVEAEELGRAWLSRHRFSDATGVPADNFRFCRERQDNAVIASGLLLTHFVDDRWTVLRHLVDLPQIARLYLFRPTDDELALFAGQPAPLATVAASWMDVLEDFSRIRP